MELELAERFYVSSLLEAPHAYEKCCEVSAVTISNKSSPTEGMVEWKKETFQGRIQENLKVTNFQNKSPHQMQLLWRDWS